MTSLTWADVGRADQLAKDEDKEVWGMLGGTAVCADAVIAGAGLSNNGSL